MTVKEVVQEIRLVTNDVVFAEVMEVNERPAIQLEPMVITPVATPARIQEKKTEDGRVWKMVTRKTKNKGKSIQSGAQLQFGSGLPGGARVPNPY